MSNFLSFTLSATWKNDYKFRFQPSSPLYHCCHRYIQKWITFQESTKRTPNKSIFCVLYSSNAQIKKSVFYFNSNGRKNKSKWWKSSWIILIFQVENKNNNIMGKGRKKEREVQKRIKISNLHYQKKKNKKAIYISPSVW